jgi:hypothetical protein
MIRTLHVIRGGLNYNIELRWEGVPSVSLALTKRGRPFQGQRHRLKET